MNKIKQFISKEWTLCKTLFSSLPAVVTTLFVLSVVFMNIFASVALVQLNWLALDAGILLSWLSFLTMDVVCKRYGAKAANILTAFAIILNLVCIGFFNIIRGIIALTPDWNGWISEVFVVLSGDWKTLLSSMVAMMVAAIVNNLINVTLKKMFAKKNETGFKEFAVASYASTMIGQFVDNFVFAFFAHIIFNIWGHPLTLIQILMFAVTGALVELLCEVIFSPVGFKISKKWEEEGKGNDYLELLNK